MILKKENLDSSMLKNIEFNTETNILTVTFQDKVLNNGILRAGETYIYKNVTEDIYKLIINAKTNPSFQNSHGKCFIQLVKNKFPYEKLPNQ